MTHGTPIGKPDKPPQARPRTRSDPDPSRRLRRFYDHLVRVYGPRQWWPAQTSLEVVVGAYLTQNTAWTSVEKSIAALKARELLSVKALREISEEELRMLIRPSGYMIRKAAAIKAFIAFLDEAYAGSMEKLAATPADITRPQLLALPGVGPETADAILLYALGQPAMVVDEYLRRVVTRHKLIATKARYAEIQKLALDAFRMDAPSSLIKHFNEFHAVIVEVGKLHCRRIPKCEGCPLAFDLDRIGGQPVLS